MGGKKKRELSVWSSGCNFGLGLHPVLSHPQHNSLCHVQVSLPIFKRKDVFSAISGDSSVMSTQKKKDLKITYMIESSVRSCQSKGQPMNKISLSWEQLSHGNEGCVGKNHLLQRFF